MSREERQNRLWNQSIMKNGIIVHAPNEEVTRGCTAAISAVTFRDILP